MFNFIFTRRALLLAGLASLAALALALEQKIASASTSRLLHKCPVRKPFYVNRLLSPAFPQAESLRRWLRKGPQYTPDEVSHLDRYVQIHPEDTNAREWLGFLRSSIGSQNRDAELLRAAEQDFTTALQSRPANADSFFHRAIVRYNQGDREDAIKDCTEALRVGFRPFNCIYGSVYQPEWVYGTRSVIREELEDWHGALEDSKRALEVADLDRSEPPRKLYWRRGRCFVRVGDWASAAADFERAANNFELKAQLFPGNEGLYFELGYALAALDRWDDAARAFRKVMQVLNGEFAREWIWNPQGFIALGTPSANKPYSPYVSLGYAHAALGERDEAIENLRKAAEVFGKNGYEWERAELLTDLKELVNI